MATIKDLKPGQLDKEGWLRRSILDEPRLSEVVAMYKEIGLDVKVVDVKPGDVDGCTACLDGAPERYKVVYTKEPKD